MRTFGLIGKSLAHSFSPDYFKAKFKREHISDAHYRLFELQSIDAFPRLLQNEKNLAGLNVTIPYKSEIIPFLDDLDDAAKAIGAVNTIQFMEGKTKGFNTDYIGFKTTLSMLLDLPKNNKALILGTGGASKAVAYALQEMGISYSFVSRTQGDVLYSELNEKWMNEYNIIINTSPVGTYPNVNDFPPIPIAFLSSKHLVYDLVYNPEETKLMQLARQQGAKVQNGYEMLCLQAEESWKIWNYLP